MIVLHLQVLHRSILTIPASIFARSPVYRGKSTLFSRTMGLFAWRHQVPMISSAFASVPCERFVFLGAKVAPL